MPQIKSRMISRFRLGVLVPLLLGVAACGSEKIIFLYPDEQLDMSLRNMRMPTVYIDAVTDMRPLEQRAGEGHFFDIKFPKDESWQRPASEIYAEALVQDVSQTDLVEVVSLRSEADYILSAGLLSLGCEFKRPVTSFLVPAAAGLGAGMLIGDDSSERVSTGIALGVLAVLAIPMPSHNRAEAEVQLTLKDAQGDVLWQETCKGEYDGRVYATATARQDQEYVDRFLTVAVKRCNACLLGQMRQEMVKMGAAGK
jgi:hypothetical protein